ncbi:alkaline phosphatase D family protein [Arhodomonas aquaeolei]|uniref:alkaline phosphatase D family protein n=1 Tax=Arhodomonas aquaeolei TaxID=2369 RepID=UPI00037289D3|nr:alkaline phosphatase D family protein [Arhodomonas aquaeolei]
MSSFNDQRISRRDFIRRALSTGGAVAGSVALPGMLMPRRAPAVVKASRPMLPYGVGSGDVVGDRAMIWSRSDRPARMMVEYATTKSFRDARRVVGPAALADTDFTARVDLSGLPAGEDVFYRVRFQDLADERTLSEPVIGHFRTASQVPRDVTFVWSGDCAGQGWGINEEWGGMRIFETMRRSSPDFFIHSGDTIYADGPIKPEVRLADGSIWKNVTTEAKSHVAETLADFRGAHAYNRLDHNVRAFGAEVPMLVQWDDHETHNNWYPQQRLGDKRYTERSAALLSARARRAFLEYHPIRMPAGDPERIYRHIPYGPTLDVFMLDMRSYRGPNGANDQASEGAETAFLGDAQLAWIKRSLLASRATWKVIGADMPLGLVVRAGEDVYEAVANGDDGPARGRELEIAELLRFIKHNDIRNVVWLTADVHYTAAHHYHPDRARFKDFAPFWEFVSGPLNAGTYGPNELDDTFGPEVTFVKAPPEGESNLPPSAGMQFFGEVHIAGDTGVMSVRLKDVAGDTLHMVTLEPA